MPVADSNYRMEQVGKYSLEAEFSPDGTLSCQHDGNIIY